MKISVILTVKNEAGNINTTLEALCRQSLKPLEIIITDGGSTDMTREIINKYAEEYSYIRFIKAYGTNISLGRNIAIKSALGDVIAVTDAGGFAKVDWLEKITEPFNNSGKHDVVTGYYEASPRSFFERCLAVATVPLWDKTPFAKYLPSSRSVAFTKVAWEKSGGYPKWLDYCEDLMFDMELRKIGAGFEEAPGAIVYWYPRSDLKSFFLQYYRYARGDGKALLWPKRHAIRYIVYFLGIVISIFGFWQHVIWLMLGIFGLIYLLKRIERIPRYFKNKPVLLWMACLLFLPIIVLTGDLAKMIGYPAGVLWGKKYLNRVT